MTISSPQEGPGGKTIAVNGSSPGKPGKTKEKGTRVR